MPNPQTDPQTDPTRPDAVVRYALAGGHHVGTVFDTTYPTAYAAARETWARYTNGDAFPFWGDGCEPWRFGDALPVVVAVWTNAAAAATADGGILRHDREDLPTPSVADVCGAFTLAELPALGHAEAATHAAAGRRTAADAASIWASVVDYYNTDAVDRATRAARCRCRFAHGDACAA